MRLYLFVMIAALVGTSAAAQTTTRVSDLPYVAVANGWGPVEKDLSNGEQAAGDGKVITLQGVQFKKGLGVHAASEVRVPLGGVCSTFNATVGVDDEVGASGTVVFQVFKDAATTPAYTSGAMNGNSANKNVSVSVTGVTNLRLVVTDGGDGAGSDHADWADARVTCTGTVTPPPQPPSSLRNGTFTHSDADFAATGEYLLELFSCASIGSAGECVGRAAAPFSPGIAVAKTQITSVGTTRTFPLTNVMLGVPVGMPFVATLTAKSSIGDSARSADSPPFQLAVTAPAAPLTFQFVP